MFATVTNVLDEYAFARSDDPLVDPSFAHSTKQVETRDVFVHRRAMIVDEDFARLRRGTRIKVQKVFAENGRGLRAAGVALVS